jgi:hypothetical protein
MDHPARVPAPSIRKIPHGADRKTSPRFPNPPMLQQEFVTRLALTGNGLDITYDRLFGLEHLAADRAL